MLLLCLIISRYNQIPYTTTCAKIQATAPAQRNIEATRYHTRQHAGFAAAPNKWWQGLCTEAQTWRHSQQQHPYQLMVAREAAAGNRITNTVRACQHADTHCDHHSWPTRLVQQKQLAGTPSRRFPLFSRISASETPLDGWCLHNPPAGERGFVGDPWLSN
jgi:hypothetical protein